MSDASQEAERIASEGTDVRERVRDLVNKVAGQGRKTLSELTDETTEILRGAGEGVKSAASSERGEVLGEVIDGVSDGLSRAANATKLALEEAEGRGEQFAEEDLQRTIDDLKTLERMFVDAVSNLAQSASRTAWGEMKDAAAHATRAAESMRPSIEDALQAAASHPVKLAGEAASAGAAATRQAVGSLFQVVGGLLAGAGDVIRRDDKQG